MPNWQLVRIDLQTGASTLLPPNQASDGVFDPDQQALYFTRLGVQGSSTKRYQGGTAQNLWKFLPDGRSLVALSDQTGELEFVKLPANGVRQPENITRDGKIFRFGGLPCRVSSRIVPIHQPPEATQD